MTRDREERGLIHFKNAILIICFDILFQSEGSSEHPQCKTALDLLVLYHFCEVHCGSAPSLPSFTHTRHCVARGENWQRSGAANPWAQGSNVGLARVPAGFFLKIQTSKTFCRPLFLISQFCLQGVCGEHGHLCVPGVCVFVLGVCCCSTANFNLETQGTDSAGGVCNPCGQGPFTPSPPSTGEMGMAREGF